MTIETRKPGFLDTVEATFMATMTAIADTPPCRYLDSLVPEDGDHTLANDITIAAVSVILSLVLLIGFGTHIPWICALAFAGFIVTWAVEEFNQHVSRDALIFLSIVSGVLWFFSYIH